MRGMTVPLSQRSGQRMGQEYDQSYFVFGVEDTFSTKQKGAWQISLKVGQHIYCVLYYADTMSHFMSG